MPYSNYIVSTIWTIFLHLDLSWTKFLDRSYLCRCNVSFKAKNVQTWSRNHQEIRSHVWAATKLYADCHISNEPSFIQLEPKSKKVRSWDEKFNHHPVMHTKIIIHGGAQWDEHFNHHRHNALSELYWISYIDYVSSFWSILGQILGWIVLLPLQSVL